jgi:hypothetical protein
MIETKDILQIDATVIVDILKFYAMPSDGPIARPPLPLSVPDSPLAVPPSHLVC